MLRPAFTILILLLFWLSAWRLFKDANALRDDSTATPKPYSLARVQLWWWTVVILSLFAYGYGLGDKLWEFNNTCLALLGVSLATTTAGRIVDNQQIQDSSSSRHQNTASEGWIVDILSDEHGLSIHRFQTVALNLMYSGAFAMESVGAGGFIEFDSQTLGLLGISSSAYLALKAAEGKGKTPASSS